MLKPNDLDILENFDQFRDFGKRVAEKLDETMLEALKMYGFDRKYIEEHASEFHIEIWPSEEFNAEEIEGSYSIAQYDIYHLEEKLFTVDVWVRNYRKVGEFYLDVQFEARKWKDLKGENEQ